LPIPSNWGRTDPLQEPFWQFSGRASGAIAFIDPTVQNYQSLVADITPGTAVYVLDPLQDAVTQITQTLLQHSGISSVHILSHGSAGSLQLGHTTLDFYSLNRYSTQLQSWSQVLTPDADILLYGCDIGAGALGEAFLQEFARLTGADLAASNNLTGSAALGGDWELEVNTGEIATSLIFQSSALSGYQFILPSELISVVGSTQGNGDAWNTNFTTGDWARDAMNSSLQSMSDDGRYVVFVSTATNLGFDDQNGNQRDVFLRDRLTGETILVSSVYSAAQGNNNTNRTDFAQSYNPVISGDGRYVAFVSESPNLVAGGIDENGYTADVFLWDRETRTTTLISRRNSNGRSTFGPSMYPSISRDGRRVSFSSLGYDLTTFEGYDWQVYAYTWSGTPANGSLVKVSVNNSGQAGNNQSASEYPALISGNGRYVVFATRATNMIDLNNDGIPDPDNSPSFDVYVRDLDTNQTILVNMNASGTGNSNQRAIRPTISDDGRYVAFLSYATDLVPGANNNPNFRHAYVRDLLTNTTQLVSINNSGMPSTGWSDFAVISGDGRSVAFTSDGTNLASFGGAVGRNVYVRNLDTNTTTLVSINQTGTGYGNAPSDPVENMVPSISFNGRYVAFTSEASNLVPNDTNNARDVFLRDLVANTTTLVSQNFSGTGSANAGSNYAVVSRNGSVVVFTSAATNLVSTDTNGFRDVFVFTGNQSPIANNDSFGTNEDTVLTNNVLTNDTDPDGNTPLTVSLVTGPGNGSLSLNPNGTFSYTPNADFNGTDTFTYSVRDSLGASSNLASVVLSITAVNDAPVAVNDSYTLAAGSALTIGTANGVLANDTDIDTPLSNLVANLITSPSNGVLNLNTNGSFTYTPNAGFTGSDSFTYRANDGSLDSGLATVTLSVTAVPNAAPIANNDSFGTNEDTVLTNNVLTNDTDPDGNTPLTVSLVTGPGNGSLSLNPNGTFSYTPNADFNGTDTFTYSVRDSLGASSNLASVVLSITAVNDAPVAVNDSYTINSTATLNVGSAAGVLANDTDIDTALSALTASLVSTVTHGTLALNADGSFTYTPNTGFTGTDSFTYRVNDGSLNSGVATVSIAVTATVNTPPIASNDAFTGNEDTIISNNVLANDSDLDNHTPLSATLVAAPSSGSLSLNPNGTFTYTPTADFNGTDTFTYIARDALGAVSNTATVVLTVNPVNDAPSFVAGANQTAIAGSGPQTVTNWATGFNPGAANESGQTVAGYMIVSNSNPSIFAVAPSINPAGTLIYTPATTVASTSSAVIGVQVQDTGGTANGGIDMSAVQFFTITVTPQPSLSIVGVSQSEGNSGNSLYNFTVSLSAASTQTVSVNYSTSDGTAKVSDNDYVAASGTLVFLPGETHKVIPVSVIGDTRFEPNETFTVSLSAPSNAQIATNSALGTILNDDAQPTISISGTSRAEGNSGQTPFVFTVSLSSASAQTVSVNYTTEDGFATVADQDYVATSGTLIFAPGETSKTITVNVIGDKKSEPDETFSVRLSNPSNAAIVVTSAAGTILNDEYATTSDFNGDGINDIVWRNYVTGENMVWLMGSTLPNSVMVLPSAPINWVLEGVGDFNRDGNPDLLWREYETGVTGIWMMSGASIASIEILAPAWINWIIEGVGDLNGDGNPDILWRDNQTGFTGVWYMNGTSISSIEFLGYAGMEWIMEAVADVNNDGKVDLVWRHAITGYTGAWLMYGTAGAPFYSIAALSAPIGMTWSIAAVGDYNQDGKTDFVWRNYADGTNHIWFMNGTTSTGQVHTNSLSLEWYEV